MIPITLIKLAVSATGHINSMIAYWDRQLICRFANSAFLIWFGVRSDDVINKKDMQQVFGTFYKRSQRHVEAALNGEKQIFECNITTPDGITKIARATYYPHLYNGEVKGFYAYIAEVNSEDDEKPSAGINPPDNFSFLTKNALDEVVETLQASIFTGFPGISALAKKHFVSESKIKRDFNNTYHITPFSYYRRLQMEKAHDLITKDGYPKNKVAMKMNFSNPSNFYACYNNYVKTLAPKTYAAINEKQGAENYRLFVKQAPNAVAMFDKHLNFIAASRQWIIDYHLTNKALAGQSLHTMLPETYAKCKKLLSVSRGNELPIYPDKVNGSVFPTVWHISHWHTDDKGIGGFLIYSEKMAVPAKETEPDMQAVISKASEFFRIGPWQCDFIANTVFWSKEIKEILEVPDDFKPSVRLHYRFFKEGANRKMASDTINSAINAKKSFDFEADVITAKGRQLRVRVVGYPEFNNNVCKKISGIFQDITDHPDKKS
jgi:AraC-like DNA-binding protein